MKKETAFKRGLLLSFAAIMILMFSVSVVLAQSSGVQFGREANDLGQWFLDFFMGLFFGSTEPTNALAVVTHLFMGLILFSFIYNIISSIDFFEKGSIFGGIVSVAVTLLTLIALPSDFFAVILPGYGAMGAAILTVIPFLIIFWFTLKTKNVFFAQMIWVIFAFYYVGFYAANAVSAFNAGSNWTNGTAWAYILAGVAGFAMIFFVPFSRKVFRWGAVSESVDQIDAGAKKTGATIEALGKIGDSLAHESE